MAFKVKATSIAVLASGAEVRDLAALSGGSGKMQVQALGCYTSGRRTIQNEGLDFSF